MAGLFCSRKGNPTPLAVAAFGLLLLALHFYQNASEGERPRRHRRHARDAAVHVGGLDDELAPNLELEPEAFEAAAAEVVEAAQADAGGSESNAEHFKQPGSEGQQRAERTAGPGLE